MKSKILKRKEDPAWRPRASEDVLGLSFLDVMSCGLGAAIFLFLIFSIMPHQGEVGPGFDKPSPDLSEDRMERKAGVRSDRWTLSANNAFFQVDLTLKSFGSANPPELTESPIAVEGFPWGKPATVSFREIGESKQYNFFLKRDGILPNDRKISLVIKPGYDLSGYEADIEILVSGERSGEETMIETIKPMCDNTDGAGTLPFYQIDLKGKEGWGEVLCP